MHLPILNTILERLYANLWEVGPPGKLPVFAKGSEGHCISQSLIEAVQGRELFIQNHEWTNRITGTVILPHI